MVTCSDPEAPDPPRAPVVHGALSFGHFASDLVFPGDRDVAIHRNSVVAIADFFPTDGLTLSIGAGSVFAGGLSDAETGEHDIDYGWVGSASVSYRFVDGRGPWPFVLGSLSVGASSAQTHADDGSDPGRLTASDARLGITVGKTFFDVWSPYLAFRAFGGPVSWRRPGEDITGSDKYHVQPAAGFVLRLGPADVFFEGAPVAEQALVAGVGLSY